jgi:hypothetical protein
VPPPVSSGIYIKMQFSDNGRTYAWWNLLEWFGIKYLCVFEM